MPEYQLYLCLLLLTRLVYLGQDGAAGRRFVTGLALVQAGLLLFAFGFTGVALATALVAAAVTVGAGLAEERFPVQGSRIAGLLLLLPLPALLQPLLGPLQLSAASLALAGAGDHLLGTILGSRPAAPSAALPALLGLLLLANEVNIVMRGVFQLLDLVPRSSAGYGGDREQDLREYNAGRVIGILERWLMFLVVLLSDDWSALGFIIAAKSVVRFDQFRDRDFAEYMLVGTLMSALFAIAVALLLRSATG